MTSDGTAVFAANTAACGSDAGDADDVAGANVAGAHVAGATVASAAATKLSVSQRLLQLRCEGSRRLSARASGTASGPKRWQTRVQHRRAITTRKRNVTALSRKEVREISGPQRILHLT